jgi:hypothetical protein
MKVDNLTFIEAVQALKDGKCEAITSMDCDSCKFYLLPDGYLDSSESRGENRGPSCSRAILLNDWYLVNPVIPTEEREVVRWAIIAPSGFCECTSATHECAEGLRRSYGTNGEGYRLVELKGIDHVPVPPKEKKRVEGHVTWETYQGTTMTFPYTVNRPHINWLDLRGKTGHFTFEED